MKRNPSMTDEQWRWFQLWQTSRRLSAREIELLEDQLRTNKADLDIRVQLVSYYSRYDRDGNNLKHKEADGKLSEHVLWLIENRPDLAGIGGCFSTISGNTFKPRTFALLREAWLQQVEKAPFDGTILGNAASFVVWNDLETASALFERAHELQPTAGWLGIFVIHCNSELFNCPSVYRDKICERIIDVGVRSLKSEQVGALFLTCEYVSDAALSLGRLELVRMCAEILRRWNDTTCAQMANAYLGLVALRENNRDQAVKLMLEMKRGYMPQEVVFRLARELFDVGERDSIVQLINGFKRKIKASVRNRWLEQIARNEPPDFQDYCC